MKKILASICLLATLQTNVYGWDANPFTVNECCRENYSECCPNMWFNAEYLFLKISDSKESVPLVITGPALNPFPLLNGPNTSVVLGGENMSHNFRSGGRASLGVWFNDCNTDGGELSYFLLPTGSHKSKVSSDGAIGSRILATPYFNTLTNAESATGVSIPGNFSGIAKLNISSSMQGAELNFVKRWPSDCSIEYNLITGLRYWNYNEKLKFTTSSPFLGIADIWKTEDKFSVRNNFYGAQIGGGIKWTCCNFSLDAKLKVALGAMCEHLSISGSLQTNDFNGFGAPLTYTGGYFAQKSNIGSHNKSQFSAIPEAEITFNYKISSFLTARFGYTVLYVSNMAYAGSQINRKINPSQSVSLSDTPNPVSVGEESPKASIKNSALWAQGAKFSLDYSF